jgi:hypothetical protein
MERYPASVGSGIFRCRSGCHPGGRGGSILNGFPSEDVAAKSASAAFAVSGFAHKAVNPASATGPEILKTTKALGVDAARCIG